MDVNMSVDVHKYRHIGGALCAGPLGRRGLDFLLTACYKGVYCYTAKSARIALDVLKWVRSP